MLVPVLGRPDAVGPLVESLEASVALERRQGWDVWPVFIYSPDDPAEVAAITASGACGLAAPWDCGPGDYAKKINLAACVLDADWFFTGADDLRFHPGWLRACISRHVQTGRFVVGTNDLGNPWVMRGVYATHLLVHRDYVARGTIDEPGKIFHEGYDHNCPDTELVETARSRGMFTFAQNAVVEHLHPSWRKGVDDATYRKGRANHRADRLLLTERRPLWGGAHIGRRSRVREPLSRADRLR